MTPSRLTASASSKPLNPGGKSPQWLRLHVRPPQCRHCLRSLVYVYVDVSVQLTLVKAPWGMYYYDSHLTDQKTEAQESHVPQRPRADLCRSRHSDTNALRLSATRPHAVSSPENSAKWARNPRASPSQIHRCSKSSGEYGLIKALG